MEIIVGKDLFSKLQKFLNKYNKKSIYIITDENVAKIHLKSLISYLSTFHVRVYVLKPGEKSKSLDIVEDIYEDLIENKYDRSTTILSLGGGVVGDISGFVASTYLRGVDYIQIPTTLLAQVDSSIGGKVGLDFGKYKNMIGSFYFPIANFIDVKLLNTLDKRELTSGLGEIIKYGIIKDYDFLKYVTKNTRRIYDCDEDVLLNIVKKSVSIKSQVVNKDERDLGIRRILNFGHTIGHGIESLFGFNTYNHGEAVILGMMYETYISKEMGLIDDEYFNEIIINLINLMPNKPNIETGDSSLSRIINIISHDKKNVDGNIVFVLPVGRGEVEIFDDIDIGLIKNSLKGDWL
ncbi:3-dehydroquinate synthase [Anaerosalibacter sp. Marseille-P3206]|uniref:3-dehydroquinate synthase n=1 Tax=Anaerosalibacter sp. Marseille-P3206 TaxID=1871005 RepID=UPI00135670E9|nr:3-dehydroquinate synthase [Anaerosalibacter sp. Marseille-P3206]